jgi:hypothetical protein
MAPSTAWLGRERDPARCQRALQRCRPRHAPRDSGHAPRSGGGRLHGSRVCVGQSGPSRGKLGRPVESVDLYLAHFLGAGGAAKFLSAHQANPNARADTLLPASARANRGVFYSKDGSPRSFAEIRDRFAAKLGGSSPLPARTPTDGFTQVRLAALEAPTEVTRPSPHYARLAYLMLAELGA